MEHTLIHDRVAAAERGENPTVICRMRSGYLVLCDKQTPSGWCILISVPVVADLDNLNAEQRAAFLSDMAAAGAAVKQVTGAYRINYSILGNTDPALHAHIQPRFLSEPDALRSQPLWAIWQHLQSVPFDAQRDRAMMLKIQSALGPAAIIAG